MAPLGRSLKPPGSAVCHSSDKYEQQKWFCLNSHEICTIKIPRNTFLYFFHPALGRDPRMRMPVSEVSCLREAARGTGRHGRGSFSLNRLNLLCRTAGRNLSSCISFLICWTTGSKNAKHWPDERRDMPVPLLEQYANPLLNFIFLIPLIRNWGIKPAGRNPC